MPKLKLKKILLIGISGTGKTTVARELYKKTGLPVYHMDSIIWSENWKESELDQIEKIVVDISEKNTWIVEGWIDSYSTKLLENSDIVIYLDYPGWLAMWGGLQRWWRFRGGKRRPELPNGCGESFGFNYLMTMFFRKERPHIESVIARFSEKNIVRLRSRYEVRKKLQSLV